MTGEATGIAIGSVRTEEIAAVEHLVRSSGLPLDGLRDHLDAAVVARRHDRVVACAAVELYDQDALLRSVAVDPTERGRGLGTAIVAAALELAAARGASQVYLLTETAAGFFPRLGFRVVSRDEVPASVRRSVEFTSACCASAVAMVRERRSSPSE